MRLCSAALAAALLVALPTSATAADPRTETVLPLGDSITHGYSVPGGYRTSLASGLAASGRAFDLVGSQSDGPSSLPDKDHEGHPGLRIDELDRRVTGWLQAEHPDHVLLLVGTNDMIQGHDVARAPQRLASLLDTITAAAPQARVLVSTIPPLADKGRDDTRNERAAGYNAALPAVVAGKRAEGRNVHLVDAGGRLGRAHLADGVHPNEAGYRLLGEAWVTALAGTPAPPVTPPTAVAPAARAIDDSCPRALPEHGFGDVPASSPFEPAIACVRMWGVSDGTSPTTYSPRAAVTRGEMAAFVARLVTASAGNLPSRPPNAFDDDDRSPFAADIDRLGAAGIVNGTGSGAFSPRAPVTRAQMAGFLVRAYDYRAAQGGAQALSLGPDFFGDDDGSRLEQSINTAAAAGVAAGYDDGTYRPAAPLRRDEMAAFLARTLDVLVERDLAEVPAGR